MSDPTPLPPAPAPRHPSVTTAFVLALLSLILFPPLAIISFFMSRRARAEVAADPGSYIADDGMLKAAWVMSIIGLVFTLFFVIWVIAFIVLIGSGTEITITEIGTRIGTQTP